MARRAPERKKPRHGAGPSGRIEPLVDSDLCDPSAFFDCLIGQQDRHAGNFRFEPATGILTLIDHGYTFPGGRWRMNDSAFLRERHGGGRAALSADEVQLLSDLPSVTVWNELAAVLRDDQMNALEWRRGEMLARGQLLAPVASEFARLRI